MFKTQVESLSKGKAISEITEARTNRIIDEDFASAPSNDV